ncbi:unnamed protein product [Prorocentrum cordatum]|uniref:Uncharacterized protein n=1 Tax=Prorocentrum cordatum TaxID=2364126 RepID=A0ABN9XVK1_9DINO|nr:unnamed protein product [Polarella glacialis]
MLRAEAPSFEPGRAGLGGNAAEGSLARDQASAGAPTQWWSGLAGGRCPISLTPLEELSCEPFGLLTDAGGACEPEAGIWGAGAVAALRSASSQAVHWFDGRCLASFLTSSGRLIDPVNRRPLSRGECESLDAYLLSNGLPEAHVSCVFDLP